MDDLGALLALATASAREAGALLIDGLGHVRETIETKSTATDMVTEIDRASELLIVERIRRERADDAILGEEGGERAGASNLRWVIDPLDGTTNYLYGFPAFAVSIAVEIDGRPAVGVVYDPSHDELFEAIEGRGATCNGEAIAASPKTDLATALVGTGFSYRPDQRAWQARAVAHLLPQVRDVRRAGAAALDLCWVARGRLDATYERGLAHWDHAAGALVVTEAGGRVAITDEPWARVVSAAPGIADELMRVVADAERAAGPLP